MTLTVQDIQRCPVAILYWVHIKSRYTISEWPDKVHQTQMPEVEYAIKLASKYAIKK